MTSDDAAGAVPLLRLAGQWRLPAVRWADVDRVAMAVLRAVADDDGAALRTAVQALAVLGPVRYSSGAQSQVPPDGVRAQLTAAATVLRELSRPGGEAGERAGGQPGPAAFVPVTIYLSEEAGHERVEQAVADLLAVAGLVITGRDEPVLGSWSRRMRAALAQAAQSPAGRAALEAAALRADLELVRAREAEVAALWMANVGPLLTSLRHTPDAVIYLGVVLIVKSGGTPFVCKLSTHQQLVLNNAPHLVAAPDKVLALLGAAAGSAAGALPEASGPPS
ncbi:MAG TPA: CATRA system-associated protein [Trebonia sp.]|nr:CATRA system-associated protein [Trebonia sp.]